MQHTHQPTWDLTSVGCLVKVLSYFLPPLLLPPLLLLSPLSLSRFLHIFLHQSLTTGSPEDSPAGPPLTAALQWFACLKRRVAQLESTVHCSEEGPNRKRLKTEGCLSLHLYSSLSLCVCLCALTLGDTGGDMCSFPPSQPPSC